MEEGKLYDFYYSPTREVQLKRAYRITDKIYHDTYINGKKYTEMVVHGKEPVIKPDDNILVCTDYGTNITMKK